MPKKKFKFKLWNIECTVTDTYQTAALYQALEKAAWFERKAGHLSVMQAYLDAAASINTQLKEQL